MMKSYQPDSNGYYGDFIRENQTITIHTFVNRNNEMYTLKKVIDIAEPLKS